LLSELKISKPLSQKPINLSYPRSTHWATIYFPLILHLSLTFIFQVAFYSHTFLIHPVLSHSHLLNIPRFNLPNNIRRKSLNHEVLVMIFPPYILRNCGSEQSSCMALEATWFCQCARLAATRNCIREHIFVCAARDEIIIHTDRSKKNIWTMQEEVLLKSIF
jgi:hypothetical protein